jgi:iron complex outermembrane receptor protein
VTATRGAVDTQKSPVSSSIVSREEIEQRNLRLLDQALTLVEGAAAYRTRGVQDGDFGVGMRGFSGRGSGQSRVLVLLDGQPINSSYTGSVSWASLPVSEVDRVEVVRGPFSSLYGGNAMGGVINVLTRPVEQRSFEVTGQYGQQDTGAWSARFGDRYFGRLGVAFGFNQLHSGGYRSQDVLRPATDSSAAGGTPVSGAVRYATPTGGVNYSVGQRGKTPYDQHSYRARLEYAFDARTFASFQYIRQTSDYHWGPYDTSLRTAAGGDPIDTGAVVFQDDGAWKRMTVAPANYVGGSGDGVANTYQAQLLRSTSSRSQLRLQAGVLDVPSDDYITPGTGATLAGGPGTGTMQHNRGTYANAQWSLSGIGRHAITMGADTRQDTAVIAVLPTLDYVAADSFQPRDTYSAGKAFNQAVYAQDSIAISDAFQLIAGGRYDYWRTYDGRNQTAAALPVTSFETRSTHAASGKVAGVYRVDTHTVLRASVGTAFRNPSVFELYRDVRFASGLLLLGNPNVDPERMVSWEAGARRTFGRYGSLDAAYYENRIADLIYRTSDLVADPTGQTRRLTNAGRGRTRGVELTGTQRPAAWLTLRQTYTFNDARITDNPLLPDTVRKEVPNVPRHLASASLTASWRRWTTILTGRYQSAIFTTDTNTDTTRGVPTGYEALREADLTVSWQASRRVGLYVNADNLFDTRYYLYYLSPGRVLLGGVRIRY